MKQPIIKFIIGLVILLFCSSFQPIIFQDAKMVQGAWNLRYENVEEMLVFADNYCTHTTYSLSDKKFIQTRGGHYQIKDNQLIVQFEFDTENKDVVGQSVTYGIEMANKELVIDVAGEKVRFKNLDEGRAPLAGLWHITERMQEGKLVPIHQTGTRKTIKLLTGTRFQWVAIDPGAKQFSGTGGGTYSFSNGKYTENIEFFSRDSSRVGASLSFTDKIENSKWHHTGLSSKGDKIYEVWSKMN